MSVGPVLALTTKERRYVQFRIEGLDKATSARKAGFGESTAYNVKARIETPEMTALVQSAQQELTAYAVENALVDAREIHEYLTDALRARITDVMNDDGTFKVISQWPPIWQQMWEKGDVEVETSSERSHDGATTDKRGGWDTTGTVTKIKMGFTSRKDLLKLAMQHKGVDAMVEKNNTLNLNVTVTAQQQRMSRLERAQARLEAAKNVTPEKP